MFYRSAGFIWWLSFLVPSLSVTHTHWLTLYMTHGTNARKQQYKTNNNNKNKQQQQQQQKTPLTKSVLSSFNVTMIISRRSKEVSCTFCQVDQTKLWKRRMTKPQITPQLISTLTQCSGVSVRIVVDVIVTDVMLSLVTTVEEVCLSRHQLTTGRTLVGFLFFDYAQPPSAAYDSRSSAPDLQLLCVSSKPKAVSQPTLVPQSLKFRTHFEMRESHQGHEDG